MRYGTRTHASQLIAAGLDVVTVSRRIGHSNPTVTLAIYAHLFGHTDQRTAEIVDKAMAGIFGRVNEGRPKGDLGRWQSGGKMSRRARSAIVNDRGRDGNFPCQSIVWRRGSPPNND